ncbi:SAM-dependent methyltransferase, partial [bacterium]
NGAGLVDLARYPRLAAYLRQNETALSERHIGKKNPSAWYRTIDRVNDALTARPKLYLPDFKGRIAPVLDRGETYPHHNLYFIASENWDLEVLGGLLLSDVAQFFIEAYGVRMRGGFLRFQAQYLRRIRVPVLMALSETRTAGLKAAFETHDVARANAIAAEIYQLTPEEVIALGS